VLQIGVEADNGTRMKRVFSTCLVALAVLTGAIPADHCVLKLAGICCCDTPATKTRDVSPCCHSKTSDTIPHSPNCPLNDTHRKPCCAYTPANSLTSEVQALPTVDLHLECVPTACIQQPHSATVSERTSHVSPILDSSQPLVYLRVQSFLL